MSEFRDSIANNESFIEAHWHWHSGQDNTTGTADAVLDIPEMQAIKKALNRYVIPHEQWCRKYGLPTELPDSVIEWVLS